MCCSQPRSFSRLTWLRAILSSAGFGLMCFQAIVSSPFTWLTVKSVNKAFLLLLLLNKLKYQGSSGKDSCNFYVGQLMVFCLLFNFFHFVKF